jgi:hypothetical protein
MSNNLALAAVTAAFGRVISQALQAVPNLSAAPELRIGRPPLDISFVGANLFLYRVTPSASRRNEDLVTRASDGTLVRRPQLALDLDYLVSFYGSDAGLEPHRLMGSVVALLHASPLLTPATIHAAIAGSGPLGVLAGSDLDQQFEPVRLTLIPLDVENLHRVWSLFYSVPYAMSVAYTASTLLLDADMVPSRAPPARVAATSAMPMLPASIVALTPPVVTFGAGATLTALVEGLDAQGARLRLGSIDAVTTAQDGGLVAAIPAGLRAGVQSARVMTGEASAPGGAVESAAAVFVLAPRVADGAVYHALVDLQTNERIETITVNLAPTPAFTQPVQLFLNPLRLPGAPPSLPDVKPSGSLTPLRFQIGTGSETEFNQGRITSELRDAFAANRMTLAAAAQIAAVGDGVWRLSDAQPDFSCRLERDGEHIAVHFGLAADYANGTLAFRVRDIRPGRYVVSVQIGELRAATSEMRWGVPLFQTAAAADDLDQGRLPPAIAAAFAANGATLSSRLVIRRPIPGDGWEVSDEDKRRRYWIASEGDVMAAYALDVAGGTFFGPLVTVPAAGAAA